MAAPRINTTAILLVLVFLVIVLTGVVLYLQLRTDEVSNHIATEEVLRTLFVAHDEGEPFLTFVLIYNTNTSRAAMLDIPGNMGSVLRSLGRVDRIDAVFDPQNPSVLREEVERAIGESVPFTLLFSREQLIDFIDLLGGMELFIINDYGTSEGGDPVLLPTGSVHLDGRKAVQYLRVEDELETELERIGKRQSFVQSFLRALKDQRSFLFDPSVVEIRNDLMDTEIDSRGKSSLLAAISEIDPERIVRRRVQGTLRIVDVQGERRELLFPHFEGQWLKQAVRQVEQTLAADEASEGTEGIVVSMEILNGTASAGLARRTSELFEDYGFEVMRFGNAESSQIDHTIVIDRRGLGNHARQVAQVIRAERIVTDVQTEADVDVTLILGKDFDGSVVRTER